MPPEGAQRPGNRRPLHPEGRDVRPRRAGGLRGRRDHVRGLVGQPQRSGC